ncbi:MAG: ABC transporter substrate-binding protein, partial [Burkholderiaceae bacterium]|nr:ABC transporter substrate-binding protein [Burkholderiaceae bacterium]
MSGSNVVRGFAVPLLLSLPLLASAQDLRVGLAAEPSSLDPHYHNLSPNNMLSRHVYDTLVSQDAK